MSSRFLGSFSAANPRNESVFVEASDCQYCTVDQITRCFRPIANRYGTFVFPGHSWMTFSIGFWPGTGNYVAFRFEMQLAGRAREDSSNLTAIMIRLLLCLMTKSCDVV
jgi:hypothetical protein